MAKDILFWITAITLLFALGLVLYVVLIYVIVGLANLILFVAMVW